VLDDRPAADPEVDVPDPSEAPVQLRTAFWSLVVVFNAALLAVSVGAMFVAFRGRWEFGGVLVVAGALAFAFGVHRVRTVKERFD